MTSAVVEALSLEQLIKAQACGLGFDLTGITSLGPVETAAAFETWIARGYAGEMDYLPRGRSDAIPGCLFRALSARLSSAWITADAPAADPSPATPGETTTMM